MLSRALIAGDSGSGRLTQVHSKISISLYKFQSDTARTVNQISLVVDGYGELDGVWGGVKAGKGAWSKS